MLVTLVLLLVHPLHRSEPMWRARAKKIDSDSTLTSSQYAYDLFLHLLEEVLRFSGVLSVLHMCYL